MIAKFTILGEPTAKGRPRFRNTGKYVQTYTPKKTQEYENLVRLTYQMYCDKMEKPQFDGMIKATIMAYFKIPQSTSKKNRLKMIDEIIKPTKKPDCDNIAKIILDALNGIAYKDDSQIVELNVHKFYSDAPRVVVQLEEVF